MKNLVIKTLSTLTLINAAVAGDFGIPNLPEKHSKIAAAQVQQVFTLKKPNEKSQTRVNLLVKDLGGSTDVSPTLGIYLTFWRDGEMGNVSSSFLITQAFSIIDMHQLDENTLVLELREYDGEKGMVKNIYQLSYGDFLNKFEKAQAAEDFQETYVKGAVEYYPVP
jgi:hypothetical protein